MSPSGFRESSTGKYGHYNIPSRFGTPNKSSSSPQIPSDAFIGEYHKAMNHQRHAFDSERVMWNIERTELVEKIADLEVLLRQYQPLPNAQQSASAGMTASSSGSPTLGSYPRRSKEHSLNEFRRGVGVKSENKPTRVFSDSTTYGHNHPKRHPNIAANLPSSELAKTWSEGLKLSVSPRRSTTVEPNSQKLYDGITFKSTTAGSKESTPPKNSSAGSVSSSRESLGRLQLPTVHEVPKVASPIAEENLTLHAGHTPLARTVPGLDGTTSALDSDLPTPALEPERPPFEPCTSFTKVPSERADSYFPLPAEEPDSGRASQNVATSAHAQHDPELQGPLGLTNEPSSDNEFLSQLDSKLKQAANSPTPPMAAQAQQIEGYDEIDPEPELRIKKSMNFGSQLGGSFGPRQ
ncbi:MAG: hypothetical protein LQ346_005641 [Caloplaca aetnensis]|nr:MAG: hypothetical protein LQ346_005641 [Caloplaca aetnensis]